MKILINALEPDFSRLGAKRWFSALHMQSGLNLEILVFRFCLVYSFMVGNKYNTFVNTAIEISGIFPVSDTSNAERLVLFYKRPVCFLVIKLSSRPKGEIYKHIVIIKISRVARNDIYAICSWTQHRVLEKLKEEVVI